MVVAADGVHNRLNRWVRILCHDNLRYRRDALAGVDNISSGSWTGVLLNLARAEATCSSVNEAAGWDAPGR